MQGHALHQGAAEVVHRQGDGIVGPAAGASAHHAVASLAAGHVDGGNQTLEDVVVPVLQFHVAARLDKGDVLVVHVDGDQHGHIVGNHNHRVAALYLLALHQVAGGNGAVDGGHSVKVGHGLLGLVQLDLLGLNLLVNGGRP